MTAKEKPMRILVFRGGALGDFILTVPAIAALRRRWPEAYIELAGQPPSANLALTTELVNRVQSLDSARMALFFQEECSLPDNERDYIRSFDLIVSYLHDPDGILLNNLNETGAVNIITVSPMVRACHASDHFYGAIKDIVGCKTGANAVVKPWSHFIKRAHEPSPPEEEVLLKWPQRLKEKARLQLVEYLGGKQAIIIHPGSGSPAKNWPTEKFAALAIKIRTETDCEPLIIGGEADEKAIAVMRSLLPDFHFLVNAPLMEVASILSVADRLIGNDSGITHLAAALGIPVVALFGPTDPAIWAPRGEHVTIIKSSFSSRKSMSEIGVETVFQALKTR